MVGNLTYNRFFGKYLLVGAQALVDPGSGNLIWGFYYSTSSDLVNWSMRQLVYGGRACPGRTSAAMTARSSIQH